MDENPMSVILQSLIILLSLVIVGMLYYERATTSNIRKAIDEFTCPTCPDCPDCPACNCEEGGCPDCVCPENNECPSCPKCPDVNTSCPSQNIKVDDIVDAIFPGRNKGLTSYGQYFPLDGLGEASVEPAYSPVVNLMPNYVGGDGVPAAISFTDQTLLNKNSSIGLAAQKDPPLMSTQGVMSQAQASDADPVASAPVASAPVATASAPVTTDPSP